MSYAAAAAKGPKQTDEEKRAPAPPEVLHDSVSTSSLIDVDSASVHTVPSDFGSQSIQTDTQASRISREREAEAEAEIEESLAKKSKAAEGKAKKAKSELIHTAQDPKFIGAVSASALAGLAVGIHGYKRFGSGVERLSWKVVGVYAGVVGLFAAGGWFATPFALRKKEEIEKK
ncbi:hypothetical protein B7494_g6846 [Chlorociboria aeruginascens]|nr:hypothetical protein B7494_g6846 [Chlorociboria aeruginascens]